MIKKKGERGGIILTWHFHDFGGQVGGNTPDLEAENISRDVQ